MAHQKCHVLLLMDIAGCHPQDLDFEFSNVKIVFFPPNTISMSQPLDLGIIQNFKTHYRNFFLRYILASIDTCTSASEVAGNITILNAIRWISKSWERSSLKLLPNVSGKLKYLLLFANRFQHLPHSKIHLMIWMTWTKWTYIQCHG